MLLAIMSGFERRGRWYVPGRMTTFTLFGGGVVDLRYADFHLIGGRDPRLFDPGRADHPAAAGGQRRDRRPRRDGRVRPRRRGQRHARCAEGEDQEGFSLWGGVGIKRRKRKAGNSD